jgi:hypothetical protein
MVFNGSQSVYTLCQWIESKSFIHLSEITTQDGDYSSDSSGVRQMEQGIPATTLYATSPRELDQKTSPSS